MGEGRERGRAAMGDDWWVEFFDHDYERLFADAISDDETERAVNDLVALVGIEPGWRILDAPGGAARHALPLALLGCHCTVVDRSPTLLARARDAAATPGADLRVVAADLRDPLDLGPPGGARPHGPPFDLVANLFNSLGYFADPGQDRVLLDSLCRHVDRDGWLVLEVANPAVARAEPAREAYRVGDAVVHADRRLDPSGTVQSIHYRIEPDRGPVRTTATRQRLWEPDDLVAVVRGHGLEVAGVLGDLDGRALDDDTDWLVVVARRLA